MGVSLSSLMYLPINRVTAKYPSRDKLQNRKRVKLNFSLTLSLNGVFLRGLGVKSCFTQFCFTYTLPISTKKSNKLQK